MSPYGHDPDDSPTFDPSDPNPLGERPAWMSQIAHGYDIAPTPVECGSGLMDVPDVAIPSEVIGPRDDDDGTPVPGFAELPPDPAWWRIGPYEGGPTDTFDTPAAYTSTADDGDCCCGCHELHERHDELAESHDRLMAEVRTLTERVAELSAALVRRESSAAPAPAKRLDWGALAASVPSVVVPPVAETPRDQAQPVESYGAAPEEVAPCPDTPEFSEETRIEPDDAYSPVPVATAPVSPVPAPAPDPAPSRRPLPTIPAVKSEITDDTLHIRAWLTDRYVTEFPPTPAVSKVLADPDAETTGAWRWVSTGELWECFKTERSAVAARLTPRGFATRLSVAGAVKDSARRKVSTLEGSRYERGWRIPA